MDVGFVLVDVQVVGQNFVGVQCFNESFFNQYIVLCGVDNNDVVFYFVEFGGGDYIFCFCFLLLDD